MKKSFKCKKCDDSFVSDQKLIRHVNNIHLETKEPKTFACNDCQVTFGSKNILENHMNKVHLNIKPYKCEICMKCFFIEMRLKKHLKTVHYEESK